MAVLIYKDGECARIEPEALRRHLEAGWSVEEPAENKPKPQETFYPASFDPNMPQAQAESTILDMMGITQTSVLSETVVNVNGSRPAASNVVILSGAELCARNKINVKYPESTLPVVKKKRGPYKKKAAA